MNQKWANWLFLVGQLEADHGEEGEVEIHARA